MKVHKSVEEKINTVCKSLDSQQLSIDEATKMYKVDIYETWRDNAKQLEMTNEPCQCDTCFYKQHDIFRCHRVIRQMNDKEAKFTCPGCQKNLDKNHFKKHYDNCTKKIMDALFRK